jgi:hypothetical protein
MVFDIRGKRRHVVKVVYAILAVLMGLSLFLVVGPVNINALLGNSSGEGNSASQQFEEQAERIEIKLKKSPQDPELLSALTRARINAGSAAYATNSEGQPELTEEAVQQFQLASDSWTKYVAATPEPGAGLAQLAAPTFIVLAENSGLPELPPNLAAAVEAQQIVAEARPSVGSLSTLAIYQFYAGEYAAAHKSEKEAMALAKGKFERESIENQLQPYEKRAKELYKQIAEIEKAQKAAGAGSSGKESLENPLGGLSGGGLGE